MLESESRGNQNAPRGGGEPTTNYSDEAEQEARANLTEIITLLEDTDWRAVPSVSIPEAAALAERLSEAKGDLEALHDDD